MLVSSSGISEWDTYFSFPRCDQNQNNLSDCRRKFTEDNLINLV
uniref:Uncharacterized protein n=1 Tax=Anguilla anguilla TaxID=7936 RepID=A0A0E9S8A2_ANGAN